MLRDRVIELGIVSPARVLVPPAIRDDELLLVHTADFVARYSAGRLTPSGGTSVSVLKSWF